MSIAYVETYDIDGMVYGIEDYEDGKPDHQHFFFSDYPAGKRKRFSAWRGGCGIGQYDTINQARGRIRDYALFTTTQKHIKALEDVAEAIRVINLLSAEHVSNLGYFLVTPAEAG